MLPSTINRNRTNNEAKRYHIYLSVVVLSLLIVFPIFLYRTSSTPGKIIEPYQPPLIPPKLVGTPSPTSSPSAAPTIAPTETPTGLPSETSTVTDLPVTAGPNGTNNDTIIADIKYDKRPNEKVVFVITLVKNGNLAYMDAALVLGKSIAKNFKSNEYDLLALVYEGVTMDFGLLKKFGWIIKVVPLPVNMSDITDRHGGLLRKELKNSGCCGELELVKLEAWRLTEYQKVILMDSDVILTKMDALRRNIELLDENKLIFNFDRGVGVRVEGQDYYNCVSAGFLMFRPSIEDYNFYVNTFKAGDWSGNGWNNSMMGFCYGGPTIQGLAAFYVYSNLNTSKESDNCRINTIGNQVNALNESCNAVDPKSIEMFHFSICLKPWECPRAPPSDIVEICNYVSSMWWSFRGEIEKELGIQDPSLGCVSGKYIDLTEALKPVLNQTS